MNKEVKLPCGYAALIGKPNVGKSTILNKILEKKVSITSHKPQTTQKQILGIKTTSDYQIIFVDTPGLHQGLVSHQKNILSKYMSRSVTQAIHDVDLVVFVVAGKNWTVDDDYILEQVKKSKLPCLLLINKIDLVKNKEELLPFVNEVMAKHDFSEIFYISAQKDKSLSELEVAITKYLPTVTEREHFYFGEKDFTDQTIKSQISEVVREKVIRLLNKEIPYDIAVEVESMTYDYTKSKEKFLNISAIIWVLRDGQKSIVVGKQGSTLKKIGTSARIDLQEMFNIKVNLNLWVKVKSNWSANERILKDLGFDRDA